MTEPVLTILDVLVVRRPQPERHCLPSGLLVAAEIKSPGSHLEDRATKPAQTGSLGTHRAEYRVDGGAEHV
jgi:hypothetical protein